MAAPGALPIWKSWAGRWILIPSRLYTCDYRGYIALQKEQDLPFADFGGQTVCRYTFRLTNYPGARADAQANLLLCGNTVIAGDVMLLGEDGGQFPLAYPRQK